MPTLLSIFHFPHIKLSNSRDGVASVDDRGRLSLRFGEDDVDEILRRGDRGDLFEVVLTHFFVVCVQYVLPPLLLPMIGSIETEYVRSARVFNVQTLRRRQRVADIFL